MKVMPKQFKVLPNWMNGLDYDKVLAWCAGHNVAGRLIRYESRDGKLCYWAVVE